MSQWLPIDDALHEAEATYEARSTRPSPYVVPETRAELLPYPCHAKDCFQEFQTVEQRIRHTMKEHL